MRVGLLRRQRQTADCRGNFGHLRKFQRRIMRLKNSVPLPERNDHQDLQVSRSYEMDKRLGVPDALNGWPWALI